MISNGTAEDTHAEAADLAGCEHCVTRVLRAGGGCVRVARSVAGAGGAAERGGGAVGAESPELRASRRAVSG